MIFGDEPSFHGSVLKVRPIGLLRMLDEGCPDDKILAVPVGNPRFNEVRKLKNMPVHLMKELDIFSAFIKSWRERKPRCLSGGVRGRRVR